MLFRAAWTVLVEAVETAVVVTGPGGAVRYVNARARALLGPDAAGGSIDSIAVPASVGARLLGEAGPWKLETSLALGDRVVPVLLAKHPIAIGGDVGGSLLLITDLTEAATAIAERDLARRNDRAKTRSLHMVAHDMGGPITILNGYVSLFRDGSIKTDQFESYLPTLAKQLAHMQRLVNVLLDTARLEEGRLELRQQPLDLVSFVERMVGEMRPPETGHQVVVRREAEQLPVLADPIRLDSIVRNLISNAVKYSPEGTSVTCTLRAAGGAELEVADEGHGISRDDLERLFTRFGRVGDVTHNPAGVGLGLYLSRELARLHGGELRAVSEVGAGSRFTLRLPLRSSGTG